MQLVIFGATGQIGTLLVEKSLRAGHHVTAVVRDPGRMKVPAHSRLRVITADIMDPDAIEPVVSGADAVVSAVGPSGRGPTAILRDSTRSLITAMNASPTRRLIALSGSMVDDTGDGFLMRTVGKPMTRWVLKNVYADMLGAEQQIHASRLDWTILRPPRLTDKVGRGQFRTAIDRNLPHGFTISRADVAAAVLRVVENPTTVGQHVFVAN